MKKPVSLTVGVVALAALVSVGSALAAPMAQATESGAIPQITAPTASPADGTMMPNFGPGLKATDPQYTVSIDSVPNSTIPGQVINVQGHTTGFSPGNWVNVWVQQPDGSQLDAGGMFTTGSTFSVPLDLVASGYTKVQVSVGKWPEEQWSQSVQVYVPQPVNGAASAVVYNNLAAQPVIIGTSNKTMSGFGGGYHTYTNFTYSTCGASMQMSNWFPVNGQPGNNVQTTYTTVGQCANPDFTPAPTVGSSTSISMAWTS